jgi:hypothetical protein
MRTLKQEMQEHIIAHLERMSVEFESYFPFLTAVSDGSTDWICSPLSMDAVSQGEFIWKQLGSSYRNNVRSPISVEF